MPSELTLQEFARICVEASKDSFTKNNYLVPQGHILLTTEFLDIIANKAGS